MLVFLLEIKCLNNSQKCPFSPLDNKVSVLPSTLWHWSRCPSLSKIVFTNCHGHWQSAPRKHSDFLICPGSLWLCKYIKELALRLSCPLSFCLNEQSVTLSEAGVDNCFLLLTDLLLFQIICLCFDVKYLFVIKQWRFSTSCTHCKYSRLTWSKIKSNQIL